MLPILWFDELADISASVEEIGVECGQRASWILKVLRVPKLMEIPPLLGRAFVSMPVAYRIWASARMHQPESWFQSWVPESVFQCWKRYELG